MQTQNGRYQTLSARVPWRVATVALTGVALFAGALAMASEPASFSKSPFDHGGAEVDSQKNRVFIPGKAPLIFREYFQSAADLYAYKPRFMPTSEAAFTPENRPVIRAARPDRPEGDGSEDGFIQTLGTDGKWRVFSINQFLGKELKVPRVTIRTGLRARDTRVVCDNEGDLYTMVSTVIPDKRGFLLYRSARTGQWSLYPSPLGAARLERSIRYSDDKRPPFIVGYLDRQLALIRLKKQPDGTLLLGEPVPLGPEGASMNPGHSGAGPVAATVNDRTYLVFAGSQPVLKTDAKINGAPFRSRTLAAAEKEGPYHPGTPQYVVCYDHQNETVSEPVLLGFGQNPYTPKTDNHNGPAILADSNGGLHVVLGAHQHNLWYVRSKIPTPASAADWTEPVPIGLRRRWDCGLTYVALAIDSRDRLHLVARNMARGHDANGRPLPKDKTSGSMMRTLDYFRAERQPDGEWRWEEKGTLVIPLWHERYSIFYQKLTVDRYDRLYLTHYYYAMQLSDAKVAEYRRRWPEENIPDPPPEGLWAQPHDPAILTSTDGGDSWHLALTPDFADGAQ